MDTIFALSSGRPPAAVSVIRVSGPGAHDAGRALAGSLPEARGSAVRVLRHPASGEQLDEALVLRFDRPASATGENVVELQCHGGRAVVDSVLAALGSIDGLRQAEPGEFTRRAFENGRIDLTEAEGLADLIEAETQSQRKAALALAEGGLSRQIREWTERTLALSAQAERAIDYDDDDVLGADAALLESCSSLAKEFQSWLARPRIEQLKDGLRVVVAGPPNVGKSSLINAIVGVDRAIVTDVPGTTRDTIEVPLALGGVPVVLVDTAGLRDTEDAVEAIGIARANASASVADILLWLGGVDDAPAHPRRIDVWSRADIRPSPAEASIAVSAVTGEGVTELLDRIGTMASQLMPAEDAIALNRRQAHAIAAAAEALIDLPDDVVIVADALRSVRTELDRLTGRAGVEDVLDALFSRFCLGK